MILRYSYIWRIATSDTIAAELGHTARSGSDHHAQPWILEKAQCSCRGVIGRHHRNYFKWHGTVLPQQIGQRGLNSYVRLSDRYDYRNAGRAHVRTVSSKIPVSSRAARSQENWLARARER